LDRWFREKKEGIAGSWTVDTRVSLEHLQEVHGKLEKSLSVFSTAGWSATGGRLRCCGRAKLAIELLSDCSVMSSRCILEGVGNMLRWRSSFKMLAILLAISVDKVRII
jgi:hypothetical protein